MTAIWQKVRPPMARFTCCRIKGGRDGRHTARGGDAVKGAVGRWCEQNDVVAVPTPAASERRVTQHNRWSTGDLNFFQFASREESNETAVGRPEWEDPALGARNRP